MMVRDSSTNARDSYLVCNMIYLTFATALNSTLAVAYSCISSTSAAGRSLPDKLHRSAAVPVTKHTHTPCTKRVDIVIKT